MHNIKLEKGTYHLQTKGLSPDAIKLIKSNDIKYISYQIGIQTKKIEKLVRNHPWLEMMGMEPKRSHILYNEDSTMIETIQDTSPVMDENIRKEYLSRKDRLEQLYMVERELRGSR